MKFFFVIAAVLGALVCVQASITGLQQRIECIRARDAYNTRIYEGRIRDLVEGLRDQLKAGIPDKNIPPMDPFEMKAFRLQIDEEFAKLDWNMTGKIDGLMSWELTDITFALAGFKFNFGILFKDIVGKGAYSIDGTVLELLPIYGNGEFDVLAENLEIKGTGKIGSRGTGDDQQLFLENFSIEVSLGKFTFGVTGLMNDEQLSYLLSQMISDSLPDLLQSFQSQIDQFVSGKVITAADKLLSGMTMKDILDLLNPPKPTTTTTSTTTEEPEITTSEPEFRYIDCGGY